MSVGIRAMASRNEAIWRLVSAYLDRSNGSSLNWQPSCRRPPVALPEPARSAAIGWRLSATETERTSSCNPRTGKAGQKGPCLSPPDFAAESEPAAASHNWGNRAAIRRALCQRISNAAEYPRSFHSSCGYPIELVWGFNNPCITAIYGLLTANT